MRYLKKYDYPSQVKADLASDQLGYPYVAEVGNSIDWNSTTADSEMYKSYFFIETTEANTTITAATGMFYSTDTGDTKTWTETDSASSITIINSGDKCYFKANLNIAYITSKKFTVSANYKIGGNILSLLNGDDFLTNGNVSVFEMDFFKGDKQLISAEDLVMIFDTITNNAFNACFAGCSNLQQAPAIISANDVSVSAGPFAPAFMFGYMFSGCTSLTTAPEISVPSVNKAAMFGNMFEGCSNLNKVTCLIKDNDYKQSFMGPFNYWLTGVSANGTFVKNKDATWWESGASGIPSGWTVIDA